VEDQSQTAGDRPQSTTSDEQQQGTLQSPVPEAEEAPSIPESIEKLGLTSEQRSRIEEILQQTHDELRHAWENYHSAHMRALELEANWIAALRDNLNARERREFDDRRRDYAFQLEDEVSRARPGDLEEDDPHRAPAPSEDFLIIAKPRIETDRSEDQGQRSSDVAAPGNNESAPAAPSDTPESDDAGTGEQASQSAGNETSQLESDQSQQPQAEETPEYVVFGITVLSPEHSVDQEPMSRSQQFRHSRVSREYRRAMRTTWVDLHRAHHQMVEIEAKKLAAIENVLTGDQLEQFQWDREQPSQLGAAAGVGESQSSSGAEDLQGESSRDEQQGAP